MYYIIYKTTNKINNKYYIGMHKTKNIDDGYLGSGTCFKNALKKYGEDNFEREILEYCNSDEEMQNAEARYITEDIVNDKSSYNLKLGGLDGWDYVNGHEKYRQIIAKANASKEKRIKTSKSLKNYYKTHPGAWTGKHHKESTKRKIGEANAKHQRGTRNSQYGTCWFQIF